MRLPRQVLSASAQAKAFVGERCLAAENECMPAMSTPSPPVSHRVFGLMAAALQPWSPRLQAFADTAQDTSFADTLPAGLAPSPPARDAYLTASAGTGD
jgi:hypothetical protein